MNADHLGTAVFWVGLLTLFGWQASAQIPRPPMPIPNVVALMPPTVPLTRSTPTPIPPPTPAVIPIPPQRPTPPPTPVMLPVSTTLHCRQPNMTVPTLAG